MHADIDEVVLACGLWALWLAVSVTNEATNLVPTLAREIVCLLLGGV